MIKFEGDMSVVIKNTMEFFQAYKKKAVFNHVLTAMPKVNSSRNDARSIEIFDNRVDPPFKVGTIWWDGDSYMVESPRICNEKYARWNSQYHTKSTSDLSRAVKNALQFIKPFDWKMVAEQDKGDVKRALNDWVHKPYSRIADAISHNISRSDLFNELKTAIEEGRDFVSPNINKAKAVMAEHIEESTRRQELGLEALFVSTDQYGRYVSDKWDNSKTDEELPEDVRTKIGLLKMVESGETLAEVGVRSGKNIFWVFINVNEYKALTAKSEE
jgi:hypothetical protein